MISTMNLLWIVPLATGNGYMLWIGYMLSALLGANQDYIAEQIRIASEYLTDEQKANLQNKGYVT